MERELDHFMTQEDRWAYDDGGPEHCGACGKDRPPEEMGETHCLWCETNWPNDYWLRRINDCLHCEAMTGQVWNPARRGWMCQTCGGMVPSPERQAEIEEAVAGLTKVDVYGR